MHKWAFLLLAAVFTGCNGVTDEPVTTTGVSSTTTTDPVADGPCVGSTTPGDAVFNLAEYDLCFIGDPYQEETWNTAHQCEASSGVYDVVVFHNAWYGNTNTYFDATTGAEVGTETCTDYTAYCEGTSLCEWAGLVINDCLAGVDYLCNP